MHNYQLFLCDPRNLLDCTVHIAMWYRGDDPASADLRACTGSGYIHGHFENSQNSLNSGARCVEISNFYVPLYSTRLRKIAIEKDILKAGCASVAPRQSAMRLMRPGQLWSKSVKLLLIGTRVQIYRISYYFFLHCKKVLHV